MQRTTQDPANSVELTQDEIRWQGPPLEFARTVTTPPRNRLTAPGVVACQGADDCPNPATVKCPLSCGTLCAACDVEVHAKKKGVIPKVCSIAPRPPLPRLESTTPVFAATAALHARPPPSPAPVFALEEASVDSLKRKPREVVSALPERLAKRLARLTRQTENLPKSNHPFALSGGLSSPTIDAALAGRQSLQHLTQLIAAATVMRTPLLPIAPVEPVSSAVPPSVEAPPPVVAHPMLPTPVAATMNAAGLPLAAAVATVAPVSVPPPPKPGVFKVPAPKVPFVPKVAAVAGGTCRPHVPAPSVRRPDDDHGDRPASAPAISIPITSRTVTAATTAAAPSTTSSKSGTTTAPSKHASASHTFPLFRPAMKCHHADCGWESRPSNFENLPFQVLDVVMDQGATGNLAKPSAPININLFGVTRSGHSIMVRVNDFRPYLYISVPVGWDEYTLSRVIKHLQGPLSRRHPPSPTHRDRPTSAVRPSGVTPFYQRGDNAWSDRAASNLKIVDWHVVSRRNLMGFAGASPAERHGSIVAPDGVQMLRVVQLFVNHPYAVKALQDICLKGTVGWMKDTNMCGQSHQVRLV
jgi:hypothetical protein